MLQTCRVAVAFSQVGIRHATKKSGGTSTNGRDSIGRRLGLKKWQNEFVIPGNIIIRQRGLKWHAGINVGVGRDHTLWALVPGYVRFTRNTESDRVFVSVMDRPLIHADDIKVEPPPDRKQEKHALRMYTEQRTAAIKKALGTQPTIPELKGARLRALKREGLDVLRDEADRRRVKAALTASNLSSELDKLPGGGAAAEDVRRLVAWDPTPVPRHIADRMPKLLNAPPQSLGTAKTKAALLSKSASVHPHNAMERIIRRSAAAREARGDAAPSPPAALEYKPGVGVVFESKHKPGSAKWRYEQRRMNRRYGLWSYDHPVPKGTPASSGPDDVLSNAVASLGAVETVTSNAKSKEAAAATGTSS